MKRLGIFAAVLAIAASCTLKETGPEFVKAPNMFGHTEGEQATKTTITVDGEGVGTIWWKPADNINVFFGTTSVRYYSTNEVDATTVVFETSAMLGSTESASDNKWGLYPYDDSASCDGSSITTTIPDDQQCVPETFGNNLYPMIAHTSTNELHFKNVCGGIKFSLSRSDIKRITFKGNKDEYLAGKVKLTMDSESKPCVSEVVAGEKTLTLIPKDGTYFKADTYYYIVALPVDMTGGFTMTFETDSQFGTFEYTDKAVEIKRSVFGKKDNIDDSAEFKDAQTEPDYVDLGLSVKWATCNLGASKPEEYGGYYQWAGTKDVSDTSINLYWDYCPYHTGSSSSSGWTKYNTQSSYGTVDNKTTLEASDDVAAVNLGGIWRMPTDAEWTELKDNCTWTWTTLNGVNGYKVQSKMTGYTDKWIFLPAAGYRLYDYLYGVGSYGLYWSSSLNKGYPYDAYSVRFSSDDVYSYYNSRYYGQSVRPVLWNDETPGDNTPIQQKPSVTIDAWADPNVPMVIAHMTITDDGGSSVTSFGIEHVSNESGNHVVNTYYGGNGTDCYANISVMDATDITLYFRAFATNQVGTTYSPIKRIRYTANN